MLKRSRRANFGGGTFLVNLLQPRNLNDNNCHSEFISESNPDTQGLNWKFLEVSSLMREELKVGAGSSNYIPNGTRPLPTLPSRRGLSTSLVRKRVAFTLAETLIALGIIGIVAALTLPTLIATISNIVKGNQMAVFERKLGKGADLLNIDNGIGPYYDTTEQFVRRLSENLKIVTICGKDNLKNCLPYETIQQDDAEPFKVDDIKTSAFTGIDTDKYLDAAGFVLGDGTPMILAYMNKANCPVSDPDSLEYKGQKKDARSLNTRCIAGFYDINGAKGPNKFGKDIVPFNGVAGLADGWISFAGLKITPPFVPERIKRSDYCTGSGYNWEVKSNYKTKYGIQSCCLWDECERDGDAWVGAMVQCIDAGGHVASLEDLAKLATYLFDAPNDIAVSETYSGTLNKSRLGNLFAGLGDSTDWMTIYSNSENYSYSVSARSFNQNYSLNPANTPSITFIINAERAGNDHGRLFKAFCVKN